MKNIITSAFLLTGPLIASEPLYRVAFDLGSGKVKMQSAYVNESSPPFIKTVKSSEILLLLRESIDQDPTGSIPEEMIQNLISSIKQLQKEAELPGFTFQSVGIGTEPFRVAKNGEMVLKRIEKETGIRLFCLSPEEETHLGIQTLRAEEKVGFHDRFVSWELGGGSTQIAYVGEKSLELFTKNLGKVPVKNYILRHIQGKDPKTISSPNPVSKKEADIALAWLKEELKEAPGWIKENPDVKVIGLGAIFPNLKKILKKSEFTIDEVFSLLSERIDKTDRELLATLDPIYQKDAHLEFLVSDLLFVYSVMESLGIKKVFFQELKGPGSTSGLLIDEPKWK